MAQYLFIYLLNKSYNMPLTFSSSFILSSVSDRRLPETTCWRIRHCKPSHWLQVTQPSQDRDSIGRISL